MSMVELLKRESDAKKGLSPTLPTDNISTQPKIKQMAPPVKNEVVSVPITTSGSITKKDFEIFKYEILSLSMKHFERFPPSVQSMPGT